MESDFSIEDAIILASEMHKNQKDKAGFPYIFHPLRVMLAVNGKHEKMTAVLHDVLEDTSATVHLLRELKVPAPVIGAVVVLTKKKEESSDDYIERIIESGNRIALNVKLADISDNSDPRRLQYLPVDKQQSMSVKYY